MNWEDVLSLFVLLLLVVVVVTIYAAYVGFWLAFGWWCWHNLVPMLPSHFQLIVKVGIVVVVLDRVVLGAGAFLTDRQKK